MSDERRSWDSRLISACLRSHEVAAVALLIVGSSGVDLSRQWRAIKIGAHANRHEPRYAEGCLCELSEESQQDTGGNGRTDNTGHVRAHGMHEQVI